MLTFITNLTVHVITILFRMKTHSIFKKIFYAKIWNEIKIALIENIGWLEMICTRYQLHDCNFLKTTYVWSYKFVNKRYFWTFNKHTNKHIEAEVKTKRSDDEQLIEWEDRLWGASEKKMRKQLENYKIDKYHLYKF